MGIAEQIDRMTAEEYNVEIRCKHCPEGDKATFKSDKGLNLHIAEEHPEVDNRPRH